VLKQYIKVFTIDITSQTKATVLLLLLLLFLELFTFICWW